MRMHSRSGRPFNNPILGPTFSWMQGRPDGWPCPAKSCEWARGMRFNRAWKSAEFLSISTLNRDSSYSWLKGIRGSINTRAHG
jgi:hypothetical protein